MRFLFLLLLLVLVSFSFGAINVVIRDTSVELIEFRHDSVFQDTVDKITIKDTVIGEDTIYYWDTTTVVELSYVVPSCIWIVKFRYNCVDGAYPIDPLHDSFAVVQADFVSFWNNNRFLTRDSASFQIYYETSGFEGDTFANLWSLNNKYENEIMFNIRGSWSILHSSFTFGFIVKNIYTEKEFDRPYLVSALPYNYHDSTVKKIYTKNGDTLYVVENGDTTYYEQMTLLQSKEVVKTESITIYPNPFNPSTTIKFEGIAEVQVYDMQGKLVFDKRHIDQTVWNAQGLSSGVYFLNIKAKDKVYSRKLILQK